MIGRLSPETGKITEVETEPNPYGIQVAADGTLWVAHNGTNKISAVNPDTLAIRYYEIPDPASRIRRLGFTSDGMVWYGNNRGRIGRVNPKTGEVKEWPSPSGPTSSPYAFTVVNDIIWYNESGMRPDALVGRPASGEAACRRGAVGELPARTPSIEHRSVLRSDK